MARLTHAIHDPDTQELLPGSHICRTEGAGQYHQGGNGDGPTAADPEIEEQGRRRAYDSGGKPRARVRRTELPLPEPVVRFGWVDTLRRETLEPLRINTCAVDRRLDVALEKSRAADGQHDGEDLAELSSELVVF